MLYYSIHVYVLVIIGPKLSTDVRAGSAFVCLSHVIGTKVIIIVLELG